MNKPLQQIAIFGAGGLRTGSPTAPFVILTTSTTNGNASAGLMMASKKVVV